jgi:hypothetical protein
MFVQSTLTTNILLYSPTNHKTLPPDGSHLAFLRLKTSKAIDKKGLGKAPSFRKWLLNWSTNPSVPASVIYEIVHHIRQGAITAAMN